MQGCSRKGCGRRTPIVLGLLLVWATACGQSIAPPPGAATAAPPIVTHVPIDARSTPLPSAAVPSAALPDSGATLGATTFHAPAYQGPSVPTPHAIDQHTTGRPAWLVVNDRLIPGTRGSHGTSDVLPSPAFLKTITNVSFPARTPLVVIVSTAPVERVSASIEVWDRDIPDQVLQVHADPGHATVFTLEPPADVHNRILTVFVRFGPGHDVTYHWRLNAARA